jgi:hypothetical protein
MPTSPRPEAESEDDLLRLRLLDFKELMYEDQIDLSRKSCVTSGMHIDK